MTKQLKADLFLIFITAVWGSSFTLMKNILDDIPPFAFLALRFSTAAIILLIIFHKRLGKLNKTSMLKGFVIGLMLFGSLALQVIGLKYTTAPNSAFITSLSVVMVPIVSSILLKKKPARSSMMGVAFAFIGLFFVSGGLNFKVNIGEFLTLLCAICVTMQIIFIDKFTDNEDPVLLGVLQVVFSAILSIGSWIYIDSKPFTLNQSIVITILVTGVLGTALAYTGQTIVQKFTSPTRAALIFTLEPVFGVVFFILIPNSQSITEKISLHTLIGCVLILLGTLVSELKYDKIFKKTTC